jgi:hypothetical protein
MRRFVFDTNLGYAGLRFEQSDRNVADQKRTEIGTMSLDGNQGAHSVVFGYDGARVYRLERERAVAMPRIAR